MHEMSLVRNVVHIVLAECEGRDVRAVRAVHLTIGEMHDVVDRYVPDLFRYLARGTVAEHAEVTIEHVAAQARCNHCGHTFRLEAFKPQAHECPHCHERQGFQICSGLEFRIDSIEIEGPGDEVDEADEAAPAPAA